MASRLGQRLFAQAVRPTARAARHAGASRRLMSTGEAGAHKEGSDTPWMIGSALIFGPLAVYLLSPPAKDKGHEVAHTHSAIEHGEKAKFENPVPVKDSEGTETSADEVSSSMQEAANADLPPDAKAAEEAGFKPTHLAEDSEGEKASSAELSASNKKSFDEDSPEDAARAESQGQSKYDQSAPGQTETSETDKEQKEKPGSKHTGTIQSGGDEGPTNLGDARQKATSRVAPKEAAGDEEKESSK